MIRPAGNFILLKATKIKQEGLIELPEDLLKKEQAIEQTGEVIAIGPTAFKAWSGCESPQWLEKALELTERKDSVFDAVCEYWKWNDPEYPASRQWGIKIGDTVEHKKYAGADSVVETGEDIYRYIPDINILGVIDE